MITKQVLREFEGFSALADAELTKIASLAVEKEYQAGAIIFQEGDSAEDLLLLREGKVAVQMAVSKAQAERRKRITIDVVAKNEVLGWSAIVEPYIYTLTAVCLQQVKALSISGTKLRELFRDDPKMGYEILQALIKVVASRLNDTRQVLVSERLSSDLR